jgi:acetolactate synthase regulatory subunit
MIMVIRNQINVEFLTTIMSLFHHRGLNIMKMSINKTDEAEIITAAGK